jgi:hypothetical protein
MMKKFILIILLSFSSLFLSSCKKFLEEQSQTEVIPKTSASLNELLLGSGYQNSNVPMGRSLMFFDDDLENIYNFKGTKSDYFAYTWQPDYLSKMITPPAAPWITYYQLIQICNVVLDYSPKVTGTASEKDYVNGQAYLLRAFYYFKLINLYGKPYADRLSVPETDLGVPLIIKSGVSLKGMPRNTVKQVYQQIFDDLDKGMTLLDKEKRNDNPYRFNYMAGHLLASRVNLYTGNWEKVISEATTVLNSKSALIDLKEWGTPDRKTKPVLSAASPETIWFFGSINDLIDPDGPTGYMIYNLSSSLIQVFEPGDLRKSIYMNKGMSTKLAPFLLYGTAKALRVSEAYLNRAEAYANLYKAGNKQAGQQAIADLNLLRKKRFDAASYKDLTLGRADDLLQACYNEKRREFFQEEEHRWFDLKRHGMPSITHYNYESDTDRKKYVLQDHDPFYQMQIPAGALALNPELIDNPRPAIRTGQ